MNKRTIRVQGNGTVSHVADQVKLIFELKESHAEFQRAVEGCNRRIEAIKMAAQNIGISPDRMKTIHFSVTTDTEYESGKRRHIGFISSHHLSLTLPMEIEVIGKFLSAVLTTKATPEVKITFEVADAEALKQKVLTKAVENALHRAETIVAAAKAELGDIIHITYGTMESESIYSQNTMVLESASVEGALDFNPENVVAEDVVTITWEIK